MGIKDITGKQFGSLTAIRHVYTKNGNAHWEYLCKCGNTHGARANVVTYESKKGDPELPSCGCIELLRKTKHGYRTSKNTHPLYKVYRSMLNRCYSDKTDSYRWYGKVGVTVCEEWKNGPEAFIEWALENGWEQGLHIDKDIKCKELGIHPHVYSPETCQFISAKSNVGFSTNRANYGKHPNVKLSQREVDTIENLYFTGVVTNKSELARMFGLKSPSSIGRLIRLAEARLD